jgi:hypothetical protein
MQQKGAEDPITKNHPMNFGQEDLVNIGQFALGFGTTANNGNQYHVRKFTLADLNNLDIDLKATEDPWNNVIDFTAVKWLFLAIIAPDGTKALRVGPQNLATPFQGPWSVTGADGWSEVKNWQPLIDEPVNGYPVTAGNKNFRIRNQSGVSVSGILWIAGVAN